MPHPDQSGVPEGGLRFIMSLRATGEGHISSIEFRDGIISPAGDISFDPVSRFVTMPELVPNPSYQKKSFIMKLQEMGFENDYATAVMDAARGRLHAQRSGRERRTRARRDRCQRPHEFSRTLECIRWLADSNYELRFSPKTRAQRAHHFPGLRQ